MLTGRVKAWLLRGVVLPEPCTWAVGASRSLLALAAALTYLLTPTDTLFDPAVGSLAARCEETVRLAAWPCWIPPSAVQGTQSFVGVLCLVTATGIVPYVTAVPLAGALLAIPLVSAAPDGGDQLAGILGMLFVPVSVLDRRSHWWSGRPAGRAEGARLLLADTALVMAKVQIAIVYFVACVGKLGSAEWANGTALFYWVRNNVFGAPSYLVPVVEPVTAAPLLVAFLTWGTLALEFFLAISMALPVRFRIKVLLPVAILFHLGILFVLGISSFAVVMVAALLLLLVPLGHELNPRHLRVRRPRREEGVS